MFFEEGIRKVVRGYPGGQGLLINATRSHERVYMRRKLLIPAKGVENCHDAGNEAFALTPVFEGLVDSCIEHVEVGFPLKAKVRPEL